MWTRCWMKMTYAYRHTTLILVELAMRIVCDMVIAERVSKRGNRPWNSNSRAKDQRIRKKYKGLELVTVAWMTQSSGFVVRGMSVITYLGLLNFADNLNYYKKTNVKSIYVCQVILHHCPRMLRLPLVDWRMQLDDEELVLGSGQHLRRRSIPNKYLWVQSGLQK